MLWTIVAILVILWLLGFLAHVTIAGMAWLIHVLLLVAIIVVLFRVIRGRRPV
jgi:hypothetical protein